MDNVKESGFDLNNPIVAELYTNAVTLDNCAMFSTGEFQEKLRFISVSLLRRAKEVQNLMNRLEELESKDS